MSKISLKHEIQVKKTNNAMLGSCSFDLEQQQKVLHFLAWEEIFPELYLKLGSRKIQLVEFALVLKHPEDKFCLRLHVVAILHSREYDYHSVYKIDNYPSSVCKN